MRSLPFLLLGLCLALSSCSSDAKELAVPQDPAAPAPAAANEGRTGPLNFAAPEGWTERAPTAAMRDKEYVLGEVTENPVLVIVAHWPTGVGGLESNLLHWKGQVAASEGAPAPSIDTYTDNGLTSTVFDAQGTFKGMNGEAQSASRLMAAYVESPSGRIEGVYTFKLTGPADQVEPWAASFHKFIQDL